MVSIVQQNFRQQDRSVKSDAYQEMKTALAGRKITYIHPFVFRKHFIKLLKEMNKLLLRL